MISITKEFSFCYGHRLYNNNLSEEENLSTYGKCTGFHGHNAILRVAVAPIDNRIPSNGMIINFSTLKDIVTKCVIERLDHHYLNNISDLNEIPTCENLIIWIKDQLEPVLKQYGVRCVKLDLYETPTSYATWTE